MNLPEGYSIVTDRSLMQVQVIHQFLTKEAYWSRGIPLETVAKAVAHSLNFGVFHEGKQVGYARIISDFATIAYLGDVFVVPAHRGKGLSKLLMRAVMEHPDLQGLRRWILLTSDAHELYRQFGWKAISQPNVWMELYTEDIYRESKRQ